MRSARGATHSRRGCPPNSCRTPSPGPRAAHCATGASTPIRHTNDVRSHRPSCPQRSPPGILCCAVLYWSIAFFLRIPKLIVIVSKLLQCFLRSLRTGCKRLRAECCPLQRTVRFACTRHRIWACACSRSPRRRCTSSRPNSSAFTSRRRCPSSCPAASSRASRPRPLHLRSVYPHSVTRSRPFRPPPPHFHRSRSPPVHSLQLTRWPVPRQRSLVHSPAPPSHMQLLHSRRRMYRLSNSQTRRFSWPPNRVR